MKNLVTTETVLDGTKDSYTDVVIVGGGGSGMTAAINVKYSGKDVILVEKMPMLGGNTRFASTSVTANNSQIMRNQGIAKSDEEFFNWYNMKTDIACDPDAVRVIVEKSGEAIDWLSGLGMDLTRIINTYGHSPSDGSALGFQMAASLKAEMEKLKIDYRLSTKITKIIMSDSKISGIEVTGPYGEYIIYAKAVILCAGGFAANPEMIAQYDKRWSGIGYSCCRGQTGDGIIIAQDIGADVAYMDIIRVNPSVFYSGKKRISMSPLRHNGAIMVNKEGKRFANEQGSYTETSSAIMEQTDKKAYMIFDKSILCIKLVEKYNKLGYFISAPTLEELAQKMGIDKYGILQTIETYKGYVQAKEDKEFRRTNFSINFENPDYYGLVVSPAVQGTFGGLKVNTKAQVIDTMGLVIPGLYAVGENAGEGTHGGSPLSENCVFGKIAAENAVKGINL